MPASGVAQTSSPPAESTNGPQFPVEVQAKLDKLNADLKAAVARRDAAGQVTALTELGIVYRLGDTRQSIDYFNQALPIVRRIRARQLEAAMLNALGYDYFALGEKQKALDYYNQALPIERAVGDHLGEATTLSHIGTVYSDLGEKQKALDYQNQALPITRLIGDLALEAATLNNIGLVYSDLGEKQKALDYYSKALPIKRAVGDRAGEAATLNNMGAVYSDLGEKQKALGYFIQVLPIRRLVGDRAGEAVVLSNLGTVYSALGEKKSGLDYYDQALSIERILNDRMGEATTLSNIGAVHSELGENQKALEYYDQALPIRRAVGDRMGEATTLNNIGAAYRELGEKQKALEYYDQALPISRAVGDRTREANTLSNIAAVYYDLGQKQKALDYEVQALPIERVIGDRAAEANTLNNIGTVYSDLGEKQKALDYYNQALPLATFVNDLRLQARIFTNLSSLEESDRSSLAILYGKLSINRFQLLRGKITGLSDDIQKSFLATIASNYRHLADLLIQQGRLPEAQQVLDLLKAQEYKEYSRGEANDTLSPLALTPAERGAEEDYERSTAKVVGQGKRWSELKQNEARTPEEERELQQLSDSLGNASQLTNEYFARLYKVFSAGADANRQVANISDETASLKQQIAKMPHTVALYTVVSEGRYSVILITGQTMVAREYVIKDKELYEKVAAFRQIILDPSRDPKPLARELYQILIGPIKADLDQAKAETLIWSLDGVLRYVPFAALYDGQHYLVENYSLASFTPVSIAHISDRPNLAAVSAAGMGISGKFDEKLKPLPKVETELDSIVQDPQVKGSSSGVMHGTILLNANFTELAMEKQLGGQHAVVHIASHFVMRPGDDSQSYLLMAGKDGDAAGYHMTVASFRDNQKISLEGTELLTLSACDTGIGGSAANGREVDGLATTAQRKGAKAVISSLWQINDNSTADLMADFYKRWVDGAGKVTKAEALRQAQLDLLLGKVTVKPDSGNPSAGTSYSQPYYWAPFVLMGNWQ